MIKISYAKAINLALKESMKDNKSVFCIGEDVGFGGAYGATQNLKEEFGHDRVRNTPISESAIIGFSIGSALCGFRPVAEMMHMDFIAIAMDQVVNQAAKMRYMFGGKAKIPLVIRCGVGGYLNAAAQHSQSLESWFTHIPGLKIVAVGTPSDARSLLRDSIEDDNPVVFLESLALYDKKDEVPEDYIKNPLGKAEIKKKGKDITIICWGYTVYQSLEAATNLFEKYNIDVEVIDLKTLYPWDRATVFESVKKTKKVLITHQAYERNGYGAEIATEIYNNCFNILLKPIKRVCSLNTPVPFAKNLENYVLPNSEKIINNTRDLFI